MSHILLLFQLPKVSEINRKKWETRKILVILRRKNLDLFHTEDLISRYSSHPYLFILFFTMFITLIKNFEKCFSRSLKVFQKQHYADREKCSLKDVAMLGRFLRMEGAFWLNESLCKLEMYVRVNCVTIQLHLCLV